MDRVQYESLVIQDLINLYKSDELDLQPWYQRRSVWTQPQKSYLINTLNEQKPIPAIYVRHSIDLERGKSIKEIVDGQQRCRAILEYVNNEFTVWHQNYTSKVFYKKLSAADRQRYLLTAIPVGYLLGANDADVIDIFGRINSVSKSLNPQEKRNAKFSGEFKQFCLAQASTRVEFWRNYRLFTANSIARMDEVQFISDLVLNLLEGLSDFTAAKLNRIYAKYEGEFPHRNRVESQLDRVFDFLTELNSSCILDTIFNRSPIFFSLFLVLSSIPNLNKELVENTLYEMDERFNADENQSNDDLDFIAAATSTTQRIKQRKVREKYIRSFLTI